MEANADRNPEHLATLFLEESLTNAELAAKSRQLAGVLIELGVRPGVPVGIYMSKAIELPIAMHGILMAGAAYVPLDPAAPIDRLREIIADCGIEYIIVSDSKKKRLSALAQHCNFRASIGLSQPVGEVPNISWPEVFAAPSEAKIFRTASSDDLSYILYTSGSTGAPKGMMHTHRSCLSFAQWACREFKFREQDILSNHAPLHFDLSILDYFAATCAGSTTAIIPEPHTKLPASYSELLEKQKVTVLYTVPFALIQLSQRGLLQQRDLSALRLAIFAGEPMVVKHLRTLMTQLPNTVFTNFYGPAEVNGITRYTVSELAETAQAIPIGKLAEIAEGLIVDEKNEPVAPGEAGELLVHTPTAMKGYLGRPELNEKAFYRTQSPSGHQKSYYRTGDIVREDNELNLWFLGRRDNQVKVRGYRIELNEIENAILNAAGTEEACAFVYSNSQDEKEIHAAVTVLEGQRVDAESIRKIAKRSLPPYAVPSRVFIVPGFPRTSTGKADRRALANELATSK